MTNRERELVTPSLRLRKRTVESNSTSSLPSVFSPSWDSSSLHSFPSEDHFLISTPCASSSNPPASKPHLSLCAVKKPTQLLESVRSWRQSSLERNLYKTAERWGELAFAHSNDIVDIYKLAQIHYYFGHHSRSLKLLEHHKLTEIDKSSRVLAAQCKMKQEKWHEALSLLKGCCETKKSEDLGKIPSHSVVDSKTINIEAMIYYLQGHIYSQLGNMDSAKTCLINALKLDSKCLEAFDELEKHQLLSTEEKEGLLNSLKFEEHCGKEGEFIKLFLASTCVHTKDKKMLQKGSKELSKYFDVTKNPMLLQCEANLFFESHRFEECLQLTQKILSLDPYCQNVLPLHIATLHILGFKNDLYLLAHELADCFPELALTWYAVGAYYYTIKKSSEARRYFSKASVLAPELVYTWIGFAHTFVMEDEHDQAISAYSTASRLFRRSHIPLLYIGMQYLQLSNLSLAEEYLSQCLKICADDPLVLSEIGMLFYTKHNFDIASNYLEEALKCAKRQQFPESSETYLNIMINLGHANRRLEKWDSALECFFMVLHEKENNDNVLGSIAYIYHYKGLLDEAIEYYHKALTIKANDPVYTDLLNRALIEKADQPLSIKVDNSNSLSRSKKDCKDGEKEKIFNFDFSNSESSKGKQGFTPGAFISSKTNHQAPFSFLNEPPEQQDEQQDDMELSD